MEKTDLRIFRDIDVYSSIFSIIKTLTHIEALLRNIEAYTEPCGNLPYSQLCHIMSPGIFRTGYIFKTLWNFDQNPTMVYSDIIQPYSGIFRTCVTLVYAETWHIWNPGIFRTLP